MCLAAILMALGRRQAYVLRADALCPPLGIGGNSRPANRAQILTNEQGSPSVTVAVVSWNTRELLTACLDSLCPNVRDGVAGVIVVDNGSSDGSAALVRELFPWAKLIENPENIGYGRAANQALAGARTPWLAIANADIQVRADALETLLNSAKAHTEAGVFAPRLVTHDGRTQESLFRYPRVSTSLLACVGAHRLGCRHASSQQRLPSATQSGEVEAEWAMGAFLVVRREAFDAVAGFDPGQWMYAEDLDLSWRMRQAGWTTRYVPSAVVVHVGGVATTQAFGAPSGTLQILTAYFQWLRRRRGRLVLIAIFAITIAGAVARTMVYGLISMLRIGPAIAARRRIWHWLRLNLEAFAQSR